MSGPRTLAGMFVPLAIVLLTAVPLSAHHSFAAFDRKKEITVTGVVKEVQWNNPHAWIQVIVTDPKGKPTEWGFECGSPEHDGANRLEADDGENGGQGDRGGESFERRAAECGARPDHAAGRPGARPWRCAAAQTSQVGGCCGAREESQPMLRSDLAEVQPR